MVPVRAAPNVLEVYFRRALIWLAGTIAVAACMLVLPTTAAALTQFGTVNNFDVFNETGQDTHGFEIELDGITSANVVGSFGAPYQYRFGTPTITDFSSGGVSGVYVRWESPYDAATHQFTQGTPVAPTPITPTAGHACWTGGSAGYLTSGCEHFGVSLTATPTNTVYHWLVADPAHPGQLMEDGTQVSLPAPAWTVTPPPPNKPASPPVVKAKIQAPPPEGSAQFGDAIWVKVFVTESPHIAILHHLMTGDPTVPADKSETETDWALLQGGQGGGIPTELTGEGGLGAGNQSVTRRYEFYKYTGPYDSAHEATPVNDAQPHPGELGDYMGAQMSAVNVPAPQLWFDSHPPAYTRSRSASISFHATSGLAKTFTYTCSLDGAAFRACTSPEVYKGMADGRHTVRVRAKDPPGNHSPLRSASWVVDTVAPALRLPHAMSVDATGRDGAAVTYSAAATDRWTPRPAIHCYPKSGAVFKIGTTTVRCSATDLAGNVARGSFRVKVAGAATQIGDAIGLIRSWHLPRARAQPLISQLVQAGAALKRGANTPACNDLQALIKAAQQPPGIGNARAKALIADVNRIRAVTGC